MGIAKKRLVVRRRRLGGIPSHRFGDAAGQGSKTQSGKCSVCDLGENVCTYFNFETFWRSLERWLLVLEDVMTP